jgi:hypothetical protein
MSTTRLSASVAAVALASTAALYAQATAEQKPTTADQAQVTTISGCVQKETDVLKRVPMTNVGMGDEFVVIEQARDTAATEPQSQTEPATPTGTSGTAGEAQKIYRVTGDKETELKGYVGQRVEITGTFTHPADAARADAAVGTSGQSRTAADTPEVTIQAIRPLSGPCSPIKK